MTRNCRLCNSEFQVQSAGQHYCSLECSSKAHPKKCETCNSVFYNRDKRRFCSLVCANRRKRKPGTDRSICQCCHKEFDNNYKSSRKYCSIACSSSVNSGTSHGAKIFEARINNPEYTSIYHVPNGTKTRIFRRMKLGCSKCGYNKTNCDLHHIRGRKVENPHDQSNLCYLCPNCHREAEQGLINADELVSFDVQVGMKWKEYNYGK